ncbi:MAG TPA: DUF2273 domain-containing protein [Clostridiales bacterium]|nr:DUF2273 domain-containing protein [Clostridiales bacterium]
MKEFLASCFVNHKGKIIGLLCGLIFGILILTLGFWKGILLLLCIALGCWLGSFHDRKENFLAFLDKILPDLIKNKMQ